MKKSQHQEEKLTNGFIAPVVATVVALLIVAALIYFYESKRLETPTSPTVANIPVTDQTQAVIDQNSGQADTQQTPNTPPLPFYSGKQVYIFVDETTYDALSDKVSRLASDIGNDLRVQVEVEHGAYSNPMSVRDILEQSYAQNKLAGSILIGNIPTFHRSDGFYTDWFYAALNDNCPLDVNGNFGTSLKCNSLDNYSRRDVFEGRITAPVSGQAGIAMISSYLDKDHAFRQGTITFPQKMLLLPSVDILDTNNGKPSGTNPLAVNVASSIASQSRYTPQNVDTIYDTNYVKQKQDYISDLTNNRYETAIIDIHGSTDAQFPSQQYDTSEVTNTDITTAKPNVLYVALLSCDNGAFESSNYLAGEFLFSGDTLLVTANSAVTSISDLLEDPPIQPIFFQPLSFLNSSAPLGEMFIRDQSLFATQIFGDPTLHMPGASKNPAQLQVTPNPIDFSTVTSANQAVKTASLKNTGQSNLSILILPNWGFTVDNKPLSDYATSQGQPQVLPGRDFQGFFLDQTNGGFFKTITLIPGESTTFSFEFSPSETKSGQVLPGTYTDDFMLLTSDQRMPYVDIPVKAVVQ